MYIIIVICVALVLDILSRLFVRRRKGESRWEWEARRRAWVLSQIEKVEEFLDSLTGHGPFEKLLILADQLATVRLDSPGRDDPRAADKLWRKRKELWAAIQAGDHLGAALKAGDVAYYAGKCMNMSWITREEALEMVKLAAALTGLTVKQVFAVARAKYALRVNSGGEKSDAKERAAAARVLGLNQ